ncbi:MAG: SRPBCC family protein [Nitrosarchaeum sp.]|nr:SRPBCC family protein [Nitrosarchaeum sp.]
MPKFRLEKTINSPRDKVFEIFTTFSNYQNLFPKYFPSVRILSTRDDVSVVEEHLMLGDRELVMMTKHVTVVPSRHEVFVIGGDAKGTHIVERFDQIANSTKLTVDVDFKLKGSMKISNLFGKNKIETDYSDIVSECTRVAEL